jgi:hypothetical protein
MLTSAAFLSFSPVPALGAGLLSFKIDNKLDHNEQFSLGDWITTDTVNQSYQLNWMPPISSRLRVGVTFGLTMNDVINSHNVDTKDVTPTLDITIVNPVWDLKLTWKDLISFTNEFNTARHDRIDAGVDLNLQADYFPPLKTTYRLATDYQEDRTDTLERRITAATSYAVGGALALDSSYQMADKEDFRNTNSDTRSRSWDFNTNYNRQLMPGIKLSYTNTLKGGVDETLDQMTGVVLSSNPIHNIGNKFKVTWDGFPGFSSNLDLFRDETKATRNVASTGNVGFVFDQSLLSLGTLKEDVRYSLNTLSSPTADDREGVFTTSVELVGGPYRYLDYSVKTSIELRDKEGADPAADLFSRSPKLDISATINPSPPLLLDVAYSFAEVYASGSPASSTRTFKLKGDFKGTFLKIPNLTFTPSLVVNNDYNLADDSVNRSRDMSITVKYSPDLPRVFMLEIGPSFNLSEQNGEITAHSLGVVYRMESKVPVGSAIFNVLLNGDYLNNMEDASAKSTWTLAKEANVTFSQPLTRTVNATARYKYTVPSGANPSIPDSIELGVTWKYLNMSSEINFVRDRTFGGERIENRKYSGRFAMDF